MASIFSLRQARRLRFQQDVFRSLLETTPPPVSTPLSGEQHSFSVVARAILWNSGYFDEVQTREDSCRPTSALADITSGL